MSTEVLVEILNVLRNHANVSVKIELSTMSDSTITTIKLKEIQRPSRKATGYPETKKEIFGEESWIRDCFQQSSSAQSSSPRRFNSSQDCHSEAKTGYYAKHRKRGGGGGISPIPQLDGFNGDLGEWEEDDGSGVTKTDIANLLKGMMENINRLGDSDDLKNIEDEDRSTQPNEGYEHFEDVKIWALAQKKPVQLHI